LQYPLVYNQTAALSSRNLEYYGKRVDVQGGPAMTWSVHTIGYLRIGQPSTAAAMFNRSYQNNVRQPFSVWDEVKIGSGADHFTTGPGGFLQAITHGYGGAALSDDALTLRPSLPEGSNFLKLRRFSYLGVWLSLEVDTEGISLTALDEPAVAAVGESGTRLEVGGGGGSFKEMVPGRQYTFAAGAELTVRGKEKTRRLKSDDRNAHAAGRSGDGTGPLDRLGTKNGGPHPTRAKAGSPLHSMEEAFFNKYILPKLEVSAQKKEGLFAELDSDGDGTLNAEEQKVARSYMREE